MGCGSDDHIVIRPHFDKATAASQSAPAAAPSLTKAEIKTVEGGDLSLYGLEAYPGAKLDPNSAGGVQASTSTEDQITVAFETPDSVNKVIDFYKRRLRNLRTGVGNR